ncbi:unnamed protein product [Protopolystoma xenopodis]|uniref:Uncharacterized protein n=1 Tax=Protopolystoma xenopodis TaxID=117903 RepID=A0A3S5CRP1_9PLAT|nr:unnamed protein product [Protopolystoma xenopodis]
MAIVQPLACPPPPSSSLSPRLPLLLLLLFLRLISAGSHAPVVHLCQTWDGLRRLSQTHLTGQASRTASQLAEEPQSWSPAQRRFELIVSSQQKYNSSDKGLELRGCLRPAPRAEGPGSV